MAAYPSIGSTIFVQIDPGVFAPSKGAHLNFLKRASILQIAYPILSYPILSVRKNYTFVLIGSETVSSDVNANVNFTNDMYLSPSRPTMWFLDFGTGSGVSASSFKNQSLKASHAPKPKIIIPNQPGSFFFLNLGFFVVMRSTYQTTMIIAIKNHTK